MIYSPKPKPLSPPSDETKETLQEFATSFDPTDKSPQLVVEIPVWSSSWSDLHSVSKLRERALSALHHLVDGLTEQGYQPKYKLIPSPTIYSSIKLASSTPEHVEHMETGRPTEEQVEEWSRSPVHKTMLLPETRGGRGPTVILI